MFYLGLDLGSSSVKASLLNAESAEVVSTATYPDNEMVISSPKPSWAEQDPFRWWDCCISAVQKIMTKVAIKPEAISGIGVAYQMHGLVMLDQNNKVIRPAIIWCDSRTERQGNQLADVVGSHYYTQHLLNHPANFTASKLQWVKEFEPENFARCKKILLPGDYIALCLTGEVTTTAAGLSEAILWDFKQQSISDKMLQALQIDRSWIPRLVPNIGIQGELTEQAASDLGLRANTPVTYRSGDQPNNAFSLNVAKAGEIAATAGTSGVIYGIKELPSSSDGYADDRHTDRLLGKANTFLHPTEDNQLTTAASLICVSGAGRAYSWLRGILNTTRAAPKYSQMNQMASNIDIGSEGLRFYPFGNGAERLLENQNLGAHWQSLDFNRHHLGHIVRSVQEGVAFSFALGLELFSKSPSQLTKIRVGQNNLFLSNCFSYAIACLANCPIEFYQTDGATGAARGAALGDGFYDSCQQAFSQCDPISYIEPDSSNREKYLSALSHWKKNFPIHAAGEINE